MALELIGVSRRYGRQLALDDVSIHVPRGSCYGFIGHNGAGKTTAIRIALGLVGPSSGRVVVDGHDVASRPVDARARLGGLVETPGFFGHMSGAANLRMLARLGGASARDAKADAARLLDLVGLPDVGAKGVTNYSQGMRQRLGIAQALIGRPNFLLLDEPTNGLDPEGIADLRDLLLRLAREEGMGVLVSSHQLREVAEISDRIGVLKKGRLLIEESSDVLLGARSKRFRLATGAVEQAAATLRGLGARAEPHARAGLSVDLGDVEPGTAVKELVAAGCDVESFAPDPPSLEEIYLRLEQGVAAETTPPADEPEAPERRVPRVGALRAMRYEARRLLSSMTTPVMLAVPALMGGVSIWRAARRAAADRALVESGEVQTVTDVNAYEAVAAALQSGLPVLALIACALASQSLAGELGRGTLRNAVLRPLRRAELAIGKWATLNIAVLIGYGLLLAVSLLYAGRVFEYTAAFEILPNGMKFELVSADEIRPALNRVLWTPIAALCAYASFGFFAGAITRSAASALGLAVGGFIALDIGRAFFGDAEKWLPSVHVPSPLGDVSFVNHFAELAEGVSNPVVWYEDTVCSGPTAWIVACLLIAVVRLSRRSVS